ncbi:MAG: hypothetical protein JO273_16690 [Methylobacteriaceae bacterium]|nr:hypothetical protein [Methylobacteriaceae bacterium]
MATQNQAQDVKRRYGDELRLRYAAHAIAVARDQAGDYFLMLLVLCGQAARTEVIDGRLEKAGNRPPRDL